MRISQSFQLTCCVILSGDLFVNVLLLFAVAWAPGRNSVPLSSPKEITLCTEVYGEPPF